MLKSILGTNCDVDRMVPWLRRGPVRVPLFFPSVIFVGAQASRVSLYLSAFTFLSVVFIDFLPRFCLFSFSPFFFFCIYYEFILAEDLCVHFPLLLISLSFSGGFLVKVFPLF